MFLPWHREYLSDLENFLIADGHPEFVPLPKWDPGKPIPTEFQVVDADCSAPPSCAPLVNTNPMRPLPSNLAPANICTNYSTAEALRLGPPSPGLESWHNGVHVAVGGTMGAFNSPAAVVFWPWHAMVDDVWRTWQCCPGRLAPFAVRDLLLRSCRLTPCWSIWLGLDDLRLSPTAPIEVRDRRGFNNEGIVVGQPVPIPGMVGGALAFDGVDDHVRLPAHPELLLGAEDFSIDAWVRTTAKGFQPILSQEGSFSFFIQDGRLGFSVGLPAVQITGGQTFVAEDGALADGVWHHVAVTIDRDGPGTLFVDSLPVLRFDAFGFQGELPGGDLFLARDAATGALFRGAIDELDVFRFVVTEAELDGIFSAGAAGKEGAMTGVAPIKHGDCLQDLRQLITTVPHLSGLSSESLLGKLDKVLERRQRGDHKGAAHMLRALHQQAHGLASEGTFDRSVFMTVAHKAHECVKGLESR